MKRLQTHALCVVACALLVTACGARDGGSSSVRQTRFPGQLTAGGDTSGQVFAHNNGPKTTGETTGGTPFHAGGAGGTPGGTATAGTVQETGQGPTGKQPPQDPGAKTAPSAPTPVQAAAAAAKKETADAQAKLDQQALLAKMDDIATRWRADARGHGYTVYEPVPIAAPVEALKAPADTKAAPAAAPASTLTPSAAAPAKGHP